MTLRVLFLSGCLLAPIACAPAPSPSTPATNAPPVETRATPASPGAPTTPPAPGPAPAVTSPQMVAEKPVEPSPATPDKQGARAGGDRCAALPRTKCMASPDCTLDQPSSTPPRSYRCRRATAPCELGIVQEGLGDPASASHRTCAAREGCVVAEGKCYCHCRGVGAAAVPDGDEAPQCDCECGHGPPATCKAGP